MLLLRHKQYNMDKSKTFAGQPILSQILDTIPSSIINSANRKHNANRYYKRIPLRVHLVSLLYGVFSYCNGLRELCEGMLACEGTTTVNIEVLNDQLVFTISNTGSILKPGMVEWINFTEKENNSYDTRPSKSGLGLMIVKRILLLHTSSLRVRVNENQNIFSFSLPIVKPGL